MEKLSGWVGGGTVILTSAPGPGLCYLLTVTVTVTGPGPDPDRSLTIDPLTYY